MHGDWLFFVDICMLLGVYKKLNTVEGQHDAL